MKKNGESLRTFLNRLETWWKKIWVVESASANQFTNQSLMNVEEIAETSAPPLRLHLGELGIFVHCSSCGSLHELETVCYRCGAVLCKDSINCRYAVFDERLNQNAVVCGECKKGTGGY